MTYDNDEARRVAYARTAKAQSTVERLSRENPMRLRDYIIVAGGAAAIIGIPLILLSFFL